MTQPRLHAIDPDEDPPRRPQPSLMRFGYWLFLLVALVIVGELVLVFMDTITAAEARDLFYVMGIPLVVLLGCVGGVVAERHIRATNERP